MADIRVRFPPSPTGYLHIGGARTALYNWLFCRKHGGTMVLRIEDTDVERSTEASAQAILEGLEWMGLDWDEGPYLQSSFADEHRAAAEKLIETGAAYRCYCTKEELATKRDAARAAKKSDIGYDGTCRDLDAETRAGYEAEDKPSVIRFRVPDEGVVAFDDIVFGRQEAKLSGIEDFVVVRSTGVPLYILSNVADDHRDRISHVIRGADHLMNTPKQVLLYQALDWEVPQFAHMALTLDPKKAKISKRRHGEVVSVQWYRDAGFLPWGFANFMCLLGWSPGDDREVFLTREELMEAFSLEGMNRPNSVFNYRKGDPKFITDPKALHINAQHIRTLPIEDVAALVKPALVAADIWRDEWDVGGSEHSWYTATVDLTRARYHLLTDFPTLGRAYFADDFEIEAKAMKKGLRKDPTLKDHLPKLADTLAALPSWELEPVETALRALADELEVKAGLLINGARAAVSGQAAGPSIFDILIAVGQERTVTRLRKAVDLI